MKLSLRAVAPPLWLFAALAVAPAYAGTTSWTESAPTNVTFTPAYYGNGVYGPTPTDSWGSGIDTLYATSTNSIGIGSYNSNAGADATFNYTITWTRTSSKDQIPKTGEFTFEAYTGNYAAAQYSAPSGNTYSGQWIGEGGLSSRYLTVVPTAVIVSPNQPQGTVTSGSLTMVNDGPITVSGALTQTGTNTWQVSFALTFQAFADAQANANLQDGGSGGSTGTSNFKLQETNAEVLY